jgi:hypothetical protein
MEVVPLLRGAGSGAGHHAAELPVLWIAGSSQQYDDTTPRNVRRRASLTVRRDISSNW